MIMNMTPPGTSTLLYRLAKKITRCVPEEQLGMKLRQFWLLSFLADKDSVAQHEIGEAFMLDANNVVLLLNELEAQGWVERRRDPADRRRHVVYITEAGRDALRRSEEAREEVEDDVLSMLSPEERDTLRDMLVKALEGQLAAKPF
jgi:DNA-binding MarR family transcriptional regulator